MMNETQKRAVLFLGGCMVVRSALVYIAKTGSEKTLKIMAYLASLVACGYMLIFIFNLRPTGAEVFGNMIWWNKWRPVHALLYFTFAYLAINNMSNAWKPLLIDVLLGLILFLSHVWL